MYIDLKYRTNRRMPPACEFLAGIVGPRGEGLLMWNRATEAYEAITLAGKPYVIDQQEASNALQQAYANEEHVGPALTAESPHAGPMKLRSVSLDEATVATLRRYGDGNLSAGIRRAALLLSGVT